LLGEGHSFSIRHCATGPGHLLPLVGCIDRRRRSGRRSLCFLCCCQLTAGLGGQTVSLGCKLQPLGCAPATSASRPRVSTAGTWTHLQKAAPLAPGRVHRSEETIRSKESLFPLLLPANSWLRRANGLLGLQASASWMCTSTQCIASKSFHRRDVDPLAEGGQNKSVIYISQ
jgi:hypothetical protein